MINCFTIYKVYVMWCKVSFIYKNKLQIQLFVSFLPYPSLVQLSGFIHLPFVLPDNVLNDT